jgi:hypothetical protein
MDIESIRPIISGLIGAAIAVWFLRKIATWIPTTCNGKSVAELAHKHRWKLRCAKAIGFAALLGGVALYKGGWFASNDWRGLGLSFGAACMLPALLLIVISASERRAAIQEALVSYAVGQDTPPLLLNSITVAGTVLFFVAAASML